jgi:signal transduction histidine kinase
MKDQNPGDGSASFLAADVFAGGGEMAELMRAYDWSQSELGPPETWPESLRSSLGVCLSSRFPFALYWGPDFNLLYNDAWQPISGDKHPESLGRKGQNVWPEIWDTIGPIFRGVRETGKGAWFEDSPLPVHRFGYLEECYFSFNISPVRGKDGTVDGLVNIVMETTYRVLNERRTQLLRSLAARSSSAKSVEEACLLAAECMGEIPADIPFALLYLVDREKQKAVRRGVSGLSLAHPACPAEIDLAEGAGKACLWPAAAVLGGGLPKHIHDLVATTGEIRGAAWPEPVREAVVLPLALAGQDPVGILVVGVSPRRALDDNYRTFFDLLAGQIASSIANARAFEDERRRAENLAEIDRAKTKFFGNVSHEFRTPLTLMLGPMEDALDSSEQSLSGAPLEMVHRNALRLMKLVNSLLDFSRVEAGKTKAWYEPTDLAAMTVDLANAFRAAIERTGLKLLVDCDALAEPVYVDHDMWEKIVHNLLSNALKFTFEGCIDVSLSRHGDRVELKVQDSGTGIPAHELPRLFERFHRVRGAKSRTREGSGIGLALVHELVSLHGGTVEVASKPNVGTLFTVSIPCGSAHLPQENLGPPRAPVSSSRLKGPASYVAGALR